MGDRKIYIILAVLVTLCCLLVLFSQDGTKAKKRELAKTDEVPRVRMSKRLKAASNFEPSGLWWIDKEKKFLVVSDDTGRGRLSNRPVLFLMDETGNVDDRMVEISGIEEVRDLEGITGDDKGRVYLMCSQVSGSSGRKKASRELLIRGRYEKRSLVDVKKVHFLSVLEEALNRDRAMAEELGIDDVGELNVEGIAWHRGKLYLGLDSPLDDKGRSLIWVLKDPDALFSGQSLDASTLQLWARVHLSSFGKKQKDGIGDMLFTGEGDLILLSGRIEGGKVWRVQAPSGGMLEPRQLKSFRNLNPEGCSLTSGGDRLFIVFDQGKEEPRWYHMDI